MISVKGRWGLLTRFAASSTNKAPTPQEGEWGDGEQKAILNRIRGRPEL